MQTIYLSDKTTEPVSDQFIRDQWRPLLLLDVFRIVLSAGFCILYLSDQNLPPFGSYDKQLFFHASLFYFFLSLVLVIVHRIRKIPFPIHVYASVLTDVLLITTIMHASGGAQSGLGVLLIVTIAASSIVMGGRSALGFASFATIIVLIQQSYTGLVYPDNTNYPAAGLLGLTYFMSAIVFVFLARRIKESEALAKKRGIDLANFTQLTEHIIQRMQTGVIVIDSKGIIRLINESAAQMLGVSINQQKLNIDNIAPELTNQWHKWTSNTDYAPETIQLTYNSVDVSPRFARIGEDPDSGSLIFLQDMAAMAQQAQQLQLASLGKLTASIAHEIRNPLGAISHAGQLLAESDNLDKNDLRMTEIISDHSQRLNTIIGNIMSLSRRKSTQVKLINLKDYLDEFVADYITGQGLADGIIKVDICPEDTMVRFDIGHLQQILINLCDNSLHHSAYSDEKTKMTLTGGSLENATRPHLDIIDAGPGVSDDAIDNLFEPFFTTESRGTGLGLYLSKELAEGNQAHLNYIRQDDKNGFFRITFQDPRRQFD